MSKVVNFNDYGKPSENTEVNTELVSQNNEGFPYSALIDFVKIRNQDNALGNGPEYTPRLNWIIQFLDTLGIEYEIDEWEIQAPTYDETPFISQILGFTRSEIDDNVDKFTRDKFTPEEVKQSLIWAFDNFNFLSLDDLKEELKTQERCGGTKAMKSMLNMLIKIKTDFTKPKSKNKNKLFNIYLRGDGNKMIMAHHDVANPRVDNCNDNSASVINAIASKTLNPSLNVVITDAEEVGGIGAARTAEKINNGYFGEIEWVLNLELTAVGGKSFFIENFQSPLQNRVLTLFPDTPVHKTPFHDGVILRRYGIDSVVINPLPKLENGELNMELLYYCHTPKDTIHLANFSDMKDFVEEVITPIVS